MNDLLTGPGDALLVVDIQNDFLPGGSLAVASADTVLPPLNRCIDLFVKRHLPVFASRDWHPADHCSFQSQGGPWPVHCVAGTTGAAFSDKLTLPPDTILISKATRTDREAYSAFDGTELHARMAGIGVKRIFIGGLTTDYCVVNTVEDGVKLGYVMIVLSDTVKAVDVDPGDGARALARIRQSGARLVDSRELS